MARFTLDDFNDVDAGSNTDQGRKAQRFTLDDFDAPASPSTTASAQAADPGASPFDRVPKSAFGGRAMPGEDGGSDRPWSALSSFLTQAGGMVSSTLKGAALSGAPDARTFKNLDLIDKGEPWAPQTTTTVGAPGVAIQPLQGLYEEYQAANPERRQQIRGELEKEAWEATRSRLYQAGEAIDKWFADNTPTNPEFRGEFLADQVPGALGSAFAFAGGGMLTRGMFGPAGAYVAPAAMGSAANASDMFEDALQSGADIDVALDAAGWGRVIGSSEAVPIGNLLNRLDKLEGGAIKRYLGRALQQGTEEAIQEAMTGVMNAAVAQGLYDPERGIWTMERAEEGAVGFTTGALMETILTLVSPRRRGARTDGPLGQPVQPAEPQPGVTELDESANIPQGAVPVDTLYGRPDTAAPVPPIRPVGVRERARAETPPPSDDDVASPLDTQLIQEGKQFLRDAEGALQADTILSNAGLPRTDTPVAITSKAGEVMRGTVSDAYLDENGEPGVVLTTTDGRTIAGPARELAARISVTGQPQGDNRDGRAVPDGRADRPGASAPNAAGGAAASSGAVRPDGGGSGDAGAPAGSAAALMPQPGAGLPDAGDATDIQPPLTPGAPPRPDEQGYQTRIAERMQRIESAQSQNELDQIMSEHARDPDGHVAGYSRVLDAAKARSSALEQPEELQGMVSQHGSQAAAQADAERRSANGRVFRARRLQGPMGEYYGVFQEQAAEPVDDSQPQQIRSQSPDNADDVAVTPSGREVPVRYAVVEAGSLQASQLDDGRANPAYPAALQPRDRTRGVSSQQVRSIAENLNPRLLDRSPSATDGAPIVSGQGIVESGNGRVMAVRRAYQQNPESAEAYREYLRERGYPVDGFEQPVLVRIRQGEMSEEDLAAYTRESNERSTLGMSATEQAMADATALPDRLLELYRGGDVDAAGNRDFVRAFIDSVVGQNDRADMISRDGAMSQDAIRRVQGALLAKAYGDADLVASMIESTDTNIKAIGGALMDVAPQWAQMRAEAAAGRINPKADATQYLLEAVRVVQRARREGRAVAEFVGQNDLLTGASIHPIAEQFLSLFFRNKQSFTQPAGRERVAEALAFYVDRAESSMQGADLLGDEITPEQVLEAANARQQDAQSAAQTDIFGQGPGANGDTGGRDRAPGQDGAQRAEPETRPEPGAEGAPDGESARPVEPEPATSAQQPAAEAMPSRDDPLFEKKNTLRQLRNTLRNGVSASGMPMLDAERNRMQQSIERLEAEIAEAESAAAPTAQPTGEAAALIIEDYTDKSIIVRGDTKPHKDRIKSAGKAVGIRALWNKRATGWVFPKKHEEAIRAQLADLTGTIASEGQALRGEKIDDDWTEFAEGTSLDIDRSAMPQVKAEHRGALANFLSARGAPGTEETVAAASLRPTQREFSEEKVATAKAFTGGDRAILASREGRILDGHHQWMAAVDQGEEIRIIRLDAPIADLLAMVKEFPSVEVSDGATAAGEQATAGVGGLPALPGVKQKLRGLTVEWEGRMQSVDSLEDAQRKWIAFRDESLGRASEMGSLDVFWNDQKIARISYNGRLWGLDNQLLADPPRGEAQETGVTIDQEPEQPPSVPVEDDRANQRMRNAREAGRNAARSGEPREVPSWLTGDMADAWLAGYADVSSAVATGVIEQPITLYHGTAAGNDFDAFDPGRANSGVGSNARNQGSWFYATENERAARWFARQAEQGRLLLQADGPLGDISDVQGDVLTFQLPAGSRVLDIEEMPTGRASAAQSMVEQAIADGYDAIRFPEPGFDTIEGDPEVAGILDEAGRPPTVLVLNPRAVTRVREQTQAPATGTRRQRKPKKPAVLDRLGNYFRPGRIVRGYAGQDRVVSFNREGNEWSVTVHEVDQDGNRTGDDRTHRTAPAERELRAWERDNPVQPPQQPSQTVQDAAEMAEGRLPVMDDRERQRQENVRKLQESAAPPGTRTNGTVEREAADRLELLLDINVSRNTPEGAAVGAIRSVVEELRKPRTSSSIVSMLDTAAQRLDRKFSYQADVVREVIELLGGQEAPQRPEGYGASNKVFTEDAAEQARQLLRKKLGQVSTGLDPEIVQAGITLAGYHIEAGARTFAAYTRAMVGDLGEAARPYLRSWYEGVRYYPGFNAEGMSSSGAIDVYLEQEAEAAATITETEEGARDGVQDPIPDGDAGAGAGNVQAAAPDRGPRGARQDEVEGGAPAVSRPDSRRPAVSVGSGTGAVAPGGRAGGTADADRVPAADSGRGQSDAAERPGDRVKGQNYRIEPGALNESRGRVQKARDNISAIELMREIEAAGRMATRAEQEVLARYVGWGGLKGAFPDQSGKYEKGFEEIGQRLRELMTDTEYNTARRSIQYAHYTAEGVARAMWSMAERLGFKGGKVFEPGMGVGNFAGLMPGDIAANTDYSGLELDHTTARIARLLYPKWGVRQDDFTKAPLPKDSFDLVIGNPPFADVSIQSDPKYPQGFLLHDYFFAKSLDAVRPGGLLVFISSAGTMNKQNAEARQYMADRADMVAAVRLPGTAFQQSSGTSVTTDIIILRKKVPGEEFTAIDGAVLPEKWVETVSVTLPNKNGEPTKGRVNRWFVDNPSLVLGEEGFFDPLYENRYGVRGRSGQDLNADLEQVVARLPKDVMSEWQDIEDRAAIDFGTAERKEGSFYIGSDGQLMQKNDGVGTPLQRRGKGVKGGRTAAELERIEALIPIRDALRAVYAADLNEDAENAEKARQRLNESYDSFVGKYGPINKAVFQFRRPTIIQQESARAEAREEARYNGEEWREGDFDATSMVEDGATTQQIARARKEAREAAEKAGRPFDEGSFNPDDMPDIVIDKRPNIDPFMDDPESYRLRSIERYNDETDQAEKGPVFFENIITKEKAPTINSVNDAVLYVLNRFGHLDIVEVARAAGVSESEAIEQLGESIYRLPGTENEWVTADEYLSGNVRVKLRQAQAAVVDDQSLQRNVVALEAAIPDPLPPSEITANMGMPWIPTDVIEEFGTSALGLSQLAVGYTPKMGQWSVSGDVTTSASLSTWGTEDRPAPKLIEDALNRQDPKVYREAIIDGNRTRELDAVATEAVQQKVRDIKERFSEWVWSDPDRAERLAGIYNEEFNNLVVREYKGDYLTTPGIASFWSWRPHQTRVIARIIQDGNTYMAHSVGAGKTSAMIGAGMEMRRLGLVRKPMYVVPNHMLGQFTKEFYEQYPTARIAVADERRFHTARRKQFIANVASEDLDAVIITHSGFGKIPISDQFQDDMTQRQIEDYREVLEDLGDDDDKRITRGRIENQIEKLEQRLSGRGTGSKDQVFTFEEMGVDFVFVDEAHLFRKLDFATKMSNVKGISPEGSKASWDLFVKTRYLEQVSPGRNLVLASGTPVTNTMAELFSVSRYLQSDELESRGLSHFDAWAGAFGDTVTNLEQDASGGYKPVTRFAKFANIPELSAMVRQKMDVVTGKQLEQYVTRPTFKGGKRQMVLAEKSEALEDYQAQLASRMEAIANRRGRPEPGDDIMLSVINDGRHAAIDMRLVDPSLPSDPGSKLNLAIDNIHRLWKATKMQPLHKPKADGGYTEKPVDKGPATQIVFTTLGISGNRGFSVVEEMRRELARRGVPKSQIAYIGDYKTHVAKQRLFNDMNEGKVRILIGGKSIFTGVNAQRRLYAMHNMDPLWFPADDEQRIGRGLRQGNMNPEIEVFDYSTKGTYDSTMWGMMETKARFIQAFFEGDPTLRDMDDLGEASQYEQAKAITTADPRLIELTELRQSLEKAMRRKQAFEREQYGIERRLATARNRVEHFNERIPEIEQDIAQRQDTRGDAFRARINGKRVTERVDAGEQIMVAVERAKQAKGDVSGEVVANIGGFDITVEAWGKESRNAVLMIDRAGGHQTDVNVGNSATGLIASIENRLRNFESELQYAKSEVARYEAEIADFAGKTGEEFTGQDEIDRLTREVRELERELTPKEPEQQAVEPGDTGQFALRREQTDTPEFRRWFGDSKVVDDNGDPLVVHHGAPDARFVTQGDATFKGIHERYGQPSTGKDGAFWFAADRGTAASYADARRAFDYQGADPGIVSAYLKLENPLIIDGKGKEWREAQQRGKTSDVIEQAREEGRDGVIIRNVRDRYQDNTRAKPTDTFVVFNSNQVKSATDNRGTFDPADPRITYALRDEFTGDAEAITADLTGRLQQLGIADKVALNLRDRIQAVADGKASEADGRYLNRLIEVSITARDPARTLNHEVIHALRDLGVLRAAEWRQLERAAKADTDAYEAVRRRYEPLGLSEEAITEEVVADMYADWAAKRSQAGGFLRRGFERIRDFLQALGNTLRGRGFTSTGSIFQSVERGDVGRRQPRGEQGRGERFASRQRQTETSAFRRWFGDSKVVDENGEPLVVYRGEHGNSDADFQSRLPSISFGSAEAASTYARNPNDSRDVAQTPRVSPVYLRIENPIFENHDDPFVEMADLVATLGHKKAEQIARKHSGHIQNTGNWIENFAGGYKDVGDFLDQNPGRLNELYMNAYPLLDDPEFVEAAKSAGFDGAIHIGSGETATELEYRIFDSSQAKSAIGNRGTFDPDNPDIRFNVTDPGPRFQLADPADNDPTEPGAGQRRQRAAADWFGAQPIDKALRLPFQLFGGINERGEWDWARRMMDRYPGAVEGALYGARIGAFVANPLSAAVGNVAGRVAAGRGIGPMAGEAVAALAGGLPGAVVGGTVGAVVGRIFADAKFTAEGRFSFLHPIMEKARHGLIDHYGTSPEFVQREREMGLEEREIMNQVPEVMAALRGAGIGSAEARVLQAVLTGEEVGDADMEAVAAPIRDAIDQMGQAAVELGLLSAESYERNRGAYLHRVYQKYEMDQGALVRWVNRVGTSRRRKIIGNQFKGRGLWDAVAIGKLMDKVPGWKPGERGGPQDGTRFRVLDLVPQAVQGAITGMDTPDRARKTLDRVYLPEDAPVPAEYSQYTDRGVWEVRGRKGGEVVLWRDFTRDERTMMGEIVDARYTITKTYMQMARDLSTGRFFRDIALNPDWSTDMQPAPGTWMNAEDFSRLGNSADMQWVKVPNTTIPDSNTKRYGQLAGRWVRAEIWRDLNELQRMQKPGLWSAALTQWKLNKTARSPVVHMNNVLSNVVLMDLADVRMLDLVKGIRSLLKEDSNYQDARDHGAFGSDMVAQELRRNVLQPLLEDLERELRNSAGGVDSKLGFAGKMADGIWRAWKKYDRTMTQGYQMEDEVFRMATYIRNLDRGMTPEEAAIDARDQFLNYDIRAPWVNAARRTVLPFISYTYRATPLVAQAIATRPWKLAKYATLAYAASALAYMAVGGDDEDEDRERRSLRDEEQGYTWIGAPRMLRMPWNDEYGHPVFLDIRRWIPAGDVFDMNQGQSAIPMPAPLQFGGPMMLAAEFFLNKQAFTGKPIINDKTDDWWDRTSKVSDWLYKSWMPSAAYIPGSWYWEKVGDAIKGVRDRAGNPYSLAQAAASSVGVKIRAHDVEQGFAWKGYEFEAVERELRAELRTISRDYDSGRLSEEEARKAHQKVIRELEQLGQEARRVFTGEGE